MLFSKVTQFHIVNFNLVSSNFQIIWTGFKVLTELGVLKWKKNLLNSNSCCCTPLNLNLVQKKVLAFSTFATTQERITVNQATLFPPAFFPRQRHFTAAAHSRTSLYEEIKLAAAQRAKDWPPLRTLTSATLVQLKLVVPYNIIEWREYNNFYMGAVNIKQN